MAYESIPKTGTHSAPSNTDGGSEGTTEVRGLPAQDSVTPQQASTPDVVESFNLMRGEGENLRLERGPADASAVASFGPNDLGGVSQYTEQHGFVVFENTATGEVLAGKQSDVSANLTGEGRFDRVTFFPTEEAASSYAEAQQR